MSVVTIPFAWLLLKFYDMTGNYGAAVILFALIVNIILSPVRGCVNASDHACSISRGTRAPRGLPYIGSPHTGCPKCFICTRI